LKYIDFIPKKIGRWWNNNTEIDIVAFDDENIAFIECKWQNSINKEKIKNELIVKSSQIESNKRRTFIVISKNDYLSEE
ncbi:MAG: ATP-binding protein, partial [Epsilonproteobacteria bacterium]|nr:ATP-binding protein [Campylobacterota bacterium]